MSWGIVGYPFLRTPLRLAFALTAMALACPIGEAAGQGALVDLSNAWEAIVLERTDVLLQPGHGAKSVATLEAGTIVIVYSTVGTYYAISEGRRHRGFLPAHTVRRASYGRQARAAIQSARSVPADTVTASVDSPSPWLLEPRPRPPKDPVTAQAFSVMFAGGGHLYAGDTERGLVLFLGTAFSVGIGAFLTADSGRERCFRNACDAETNWRPLYFGLGMGSVLWMIGVIDARNAVERSNRGRRPPHESLGLELMRDPGGDAHRVGVRLAARF